MKTVLPPAAKIDPSRTTLLRRAFAGALVKRVMLVKAACARKLVTEDAFGPVTNAGEWALLSPSQKSKAFADWLRTVLPATFRGASDDAVYKAYLEQAFKKGVSRSLLEGRRGKPPDSDSLPGLPGADVKLVLGGPASRDALDALIQRVHTDIKGLTDDTELKLVRGLADGLAAGLNPTDIARGLSKTLDVSAERARTIARTEIVRAHADGQLVALKASGVSTLGVAVEWVTGGNPCPRCAAWKGSVVKVDEAGGLIPHHPNCRCCWVPALPEYLTKKPKRVGVSNHTGVVINRTSPPYLLSQEDGGRFVNAEFYRTAYRNLAEFSDWARTDEAWYVGNVFCATGPGGGVDPYCTAGSTAASHPHLSSGQAVYEHLKAHGLPELAAQKAKHLNPNGVVGGVIHISPLPNAAPNQAQKSLVEAAVPGVTVKHKYITAKHLTGDPIVPAAPASTLSPKPSKSPKPAPVPPPATPPPVVPKTIGPGPLPATYGGLKVGHKYQNSAGKVQDVEAVTDQGANVLVKFKDQPTAFAIPKDKAFAFKEPPAKVSVTDAEKYAGTKTGTVGTQAKAPNQKKSVEEAHEKAKVLVGRLTPGEKAAVTSYTGSAYGAINSAMRKCPPEFECVKGGIKEKMDNILSAVGKADPLSAPVLVERGMHLGDGADLKNFVNAAYDLHAAGAHFQFPALTSTGIGFKFGGNVTFKILSRSAPFIKPLSSNKVEEEVLISPKTKFKVLGVEDKGGYKYTVHLEEI